MRAVIAGIWLLIGLGGAAAEESGSAARGRMLADRLCSECHAVQPGETDSPRPDAASFGVIADTPGMSELALEVWLTTPHRNMPHLILDADERNDLIAYIVSLKQ
jgi:cytochrome c2